MAQRVSQIVITALYGGATVRCRVSQTTVATIYLTGSVRQRVTQNTLQVLRLIRTGWNYGCIVE